MSLVWKLSCSARGGFFSVLKPPSSLSFLSAHALALCVTKEMKAMRRKCPQTPTIAPGPVAGHPVPSCCYAQAVCAPVIWAVACLPTSSMFSSRLSHSHQLSNRIISPTLTVFSLGSISTFSYHAISLLSFTCTYNKAP